MDDFYLRRTTLNLGVIASKAWGKSKKRWQSFDLKRYSYYALHLWTTLRVYLPHYDHMVLLLLLKVWLLLDTVACGLQNQTYWSWQWWIFKWWETFRDALCPLFTIIMCLPSNIVSSPVGGILIWFKMSILKC